MSEPCLCKGYFMLLWKEPFGEEKPGESNGGFKNKHVWFYNGCEVLFKIWIGSQAR